MVETMLAFVLVMMGMVVDRIFVWAWGWEREDPVAEILKQKLKKENIR